MLNKQCAPRLRCESDHDVACMYIHEFDSLLYFHLRNNFHIYFATEWCGNRFVVMQQSTQQPCCNSKCIAAEPGPWPVSGVKLIMSGVLDQNLAHHLPTDIWGKWKIFTL